jgi:hypothetical protein
MAIEAGQLRFRINFGTPICHNCTGLKAGPGVLATCFQVQQCNYANIKEGELTDKQQRLLETLQGA